jgi:hypothetical protein
MSLGTDQVIAMIASIGACLSAVSALLVNLQNSKQRKSSYRPELMIKRINFRSTGVTSNSIPENWKEINAHDEQTNPGYIFHINVLNIGLGSAKKIEICWDFDFEKYTTYVNHLAQIALIPAYLDYKNNTITINSESITSSFSVWKNQKNQTLDYILPVSIDKDGIQIMFPPAISLIISSAVFFSRKDKNKNGLPEIPEIDLKITFYDLGNRKIIEKFKINTCIYMMATKDEKEMFEGSLEAVKKFI